MVGKLPVPSSGALRALRRLAWAGSTLGAISGVCGIATLNYDVNRRIRAVKRSVETKRELQSKQNHKSKSHLARMVEAAEAGNFLGLDSIRPTPEKAAGSRNNHVLNDFLGQVIRRTRGSDTSAHLGPTVSPIPTARTQSHAAQRIITATLQQHKMPTHKVFGGARHKAVGTWSEGPSPIDPAAHMWTGGSVTPGPPSPTVSETRVEQTQSHAAQKIMIATLRQLKAGTHTVFGRASKESRRSDPSLKLAEPVGRWLYGPEASKVSSKDQGARTSTSVSYKKPVSSHGYGL